MRIIEKSLLALNFPFHNKHKFIMSLLIFESLNTATVDSLLTDCFDVIMIFVVNTNIVEHDKLLPGSCFSPLCLLCRIYRGLLTIYNDTVLIIVYSKIMTFYS